MNTDFYIICDGKPFAADNAVSNGTLFIKTVKKEYPEYGIIEQWLEIENISQQPVSLTRVDSMRTVLPKGDYTLRYFKCLIQEFIPEVKQLRGTFVFEETDGRSSHSNHPWISLTDEKYGVLSCSIAWSGNWIFRLEPGADETYTLTAGISDWCFCKELKPGERFESVPVVYTYQPKGDMDTAALAFQRWGKAHVYPKTSWSEPVPVAWNHWWPYEDVEINEDVFKANVDVCAEMGIDACVLDAGWFGQPDPDCNSNDQGWSLDVDWYLKRGDWKVVNTLRFPSGIADLAKYVNEKGIRFGIWCEIEALGKKAWLREEHPEYVALRDGESLDYICLGNPDAVDWAFGILEHLIVDYHAEWIKIDFNLDPKNGCNRCDHGHGAGDGLYEHYRGYYRLLERIREKYPDVFLENCSSGGRRIDLGIAKHTHAAFLSDPDHTQLHLREFWGAIETLHPSHCYHFSWSQNRVAYDSNLEMDPIKEGTPIHRLDYIIRANMMNRFAVSYRMPELSKDMKERLSYHIRLYKDVARDFVLNGETYRLTEQAYTGKDVYWNAFLQLKDGGSLGLLYVFKLKTGEEDTKIKLKGLEREQSYSLRFEDGGQTMIMSGADLMDQGLSFGHLPEEASEMVYIKRSNVI